ncbi:MAG: helix-turn-helix transcriptional regulator [Clostridia bacterium]|nr:helix-turn-helix transcriptional regulator [Clostridia bacterium]
MTQEQLAEMIDVATPTISYIETGTKAIRPENLAKLCEVLDISADYLLFGRSTAVETSHLTAKLTGLSAAELAAIESIIDNCLSLAGKAKK